MSPMYKIVLMRPVEKYLDKLNSADRSRILSALTRLRLRPQVHLIRLVGKDLYKFRVGNYRLIIDLHRDELLVLVVDVGHRKNIYKK